MDVSHVGDATTFNPAASGLPYSAASGTPADPTVDYHLALRTASLKLRGNLPALDEQQRLTQAVNSADPAQAQAVYETLVRSYIYDSPMTFNRQMFHFSVGVAQSKAILRTYQTPRAAHRPSQPASDESLPYERGRQRDAGPAAQS